MPGFTLRHLIVKRIFLPVLLSQQQPGIFERTHQSLLLRRRLFIEVSGCTFERLF
jgi:hypothetical protein